MSKELKEVEKEIIKCMTCGNCQAVCPLYKETRAEAAVARGKVQLAKAVLNGKLDYTAGLAHRFDLCLTCMACVANCPCGVRVDKIVLAARAALTKNRGLPFPQRVAVAGLSRPALMDMGMKAAGLTQGLLFKRGERGMSPRFPMGLELRRVLPPLTRRPLKEQLPEKNLVPDPVMRVAFFAGCVTNYVFPQVGRALVEVLNRHGVEVVFPRAQHCCGTPVFIHGAKDTAREMAASQVDIFTKAGVDAVVTVCGTCGEAFRHYYPQLLANHPDHARNANTLAERTYDIAEFLTGVVPLNKDLLGPLDTSFTYHEPCHIGRGLGAAGKAEELLKAIPGAKYSPLTEPGRCCGGAGSFTFEHYDLSFKVLERKLDDIAGSGAGVVVTGCGSCRIQLNEGLARRKMPQRVLHTVEMLALSIESGRERGNRDGKQ